MVKMQTALSIAFFSAVFAFGEVGIKTTDSTVSLGIKGAGWLEMGQFAKFANKNSEKNHQWIERSFADLGLNARIGKHLSIETDIEGRMWLNIPKGGGTGQAVYVHRLNSTFIVDQAFGSFCEGDSSSNFVSATFGRFRYKYNPDARNLGEYLFRTGTYPAYIINNFDLPLARLSGFKLTGDFGNGLLNNDLLLTFETDIPPYYDASLSYIGSLPLQKVSDYFPVTVGWGVQCSHLLSVYEDITTPKNSPKDIIHMRHISLAGDTTFDSTYYTFRGVKIMARLSFNPVDLAGKLLGMNLFNLFGSEDGKIYAEAALLGAKNYPANDTLNPYSTIPAIGGNIWGYDDWKKKTPVLIGFNVPAFKMLDVLSLEAEWYGSPYANDYYNELGVGPNASLPIPDYDPGFNYNKDNWKWSIYAKKMFAKGHMGVVAQIARDHIRTETVVDEGADLEEALRTSSHWWWMAKFIGQF